MLDLTKTLIRLLLRGNRCPECSYAEQAMKASIERKEMFTIKLIPPEEGKVCWHIYFIDAKSESDRSKTGHI